MIAQDKEELSGQQVGSYELVSLVAEHRVSDLFLARDIKLERLVYLEVLRTAEDEDADTAARFRRRMETISQVKNENIAVVTDIDVTEDGRPYAVIDYFAATTLAQYIEGLRDSNRNLPPIAALELGRDLAQGLSAAHAVDLIHHDLRPQNIMMREDGVPIWIDFGVPMSANAPRSVLAKSDAEMLDYASPEELEGKAITRRSNFYSMGVILYELLAGHRPLMPTLPFDIFPQANMPKEEPLEDARPGLAGETYRLVRNCMWRQEWSRFETADEMLTAIETAIFAEQELPKAAAWSPGRSRSTFLLIPLAVIALGAMAFLFMRFVRGDGGGEPVATVAVATAAGGNTTVPVVGGSTPEEEVLAPQIGTVTPEPTIGLPTEAPFDVSISVLAPVPNREFGPQDIINFDWFWPTIPAPGRQFTVYLIDGDKTTALGSLREPNNGSAYRLPIAVADLPTESTEVAWQIRLETLDGRETLVTSDEVPMLLVAAAGSPTVAASATGTPTPSATPTSEACVVQPPPGWSVYVVKRGDALARLAQNGNVPIGTVMRVNCLENDLLSVGQQLWLPGIVATATPQPVATPVPQPTSSGGGGVQPATTVPTSVPNTPVPPTDEPTSIPPTDPPVTPPTATPPPG